MLICYSVFKKYSVFQLISSASANSISDGRAVCLPFRSVHDFRAIRRGQRYEKTAIVVLRRAVF